MPRAASQEREPAAPSAYTSPRAALAAEPDFAATPYAAPRPAAPGRRILVRPPFPLRIAGTVVGLVGAVAVAAGLVALFFAVRAAFTDQPSRTGIVLRLGFPAVVALLVILFGGGLVRSVGRQVRTQAEMLVSAAVILTAVGVVMTDLATRSHLSVHAVEYDEVVVGRSLTVVDTVAAPDTWNAQRWAAVGLGGLVALGLLGLVLGGLWRHRWNDTVVVVIIVAAAVVAGLVRQQAGADAAQARLVRAAHACAQIARYAGDTPAQRAARCADPYAEPARVGSR